MTAPAITFRPLWPDSTMSNAMLGNLIIGRVSRQESGKGRWICWLPKPNGLTYCDWRDTRSELAARNALVTHVRDWLRQGGLIE